mmetsp:Transcript_53248/g.95090  ORF Transcript_53248/g.95090 Transcript_53248/m.95090 type:complete len:125 (+) Transcript_53248:2305-2679(+)
MLGFQVMQRQSTTVQGLVPTTLNFFSLVIQCLISRELFCLQSDVSHFFKAHTWPKDPDSGSQYTTTLHTKSSPTPAPQKPPISAPLPHPNQSDFSCCKGGEEAIYPLPPPPPPTQQKKKKIQSV